VALRPGERVKFRTRGGRSAERYGTLVGGFGKDRYHVFEPGKLEHHVVHYRDLATAKRRRTRAQRLEAAAQARKHAGSDHARATYGAEVAGRFHDSAAHAHRLVFNEGDQPGLFGEANPLGRWAGWGPTGPDDAQFAAFTGVPVESPEGLNTREDPIPARKASPSGGTEDPDPYNRDPRVSRYVSESFRERLAAEAIREIRQL
jgi:hypothetical protein